MAKQGKNKKIALVGYKLAGGGLERVFSTVSKLLHTSDFEISVIVLESKVEYPHNGNLINLGNYSKFQKYFKLRKVLQTNQFDYIIDFRHRINPWMELVFLTYIYAGFKVIYTIHSSKLGVYLTDRRWIAKQILQKAYKVVTVSKALNEKIKTDYSFENGIVIPNSTDVRDEQFKSDFLEVPYKYCIAVGRLTRLKQLDKLIETYSKSDLLTASVHLVIVGEGEEKLILQKRIEDLKMTSYIHLLGFKKDTPSYIEKAEFLVLTSKYEGFPMVVLEALHIGTPVISFDCETGPSEMISNEYNGLLVKNQNFKALQEALNRMVSDVELYKWCKKNAKESVQLFSAENIQRKWEDLLSNNSI